jgi:hypothetical protein
MVVAVSYKTAQELASQVCIIIFKCIEGYKKITAAFLTYSCSARTEGTRRAKHLHYCWWFCVFKENVVMYWMFSLVMKHGFTL